MREQLEQKLEQAADYFSKEYQFEFSSLQMKQFVLYFEHLLQVNQVMNLTAITRPEDVAELHFLDSLTVLPYLPDQKSFLMIDVGTGAGLPGLPLKTARPEIDLTLLDATKKRIRFLEECIELTALSGEVKTVHARAEEIAKQKAYREQFDIAIARAVAALPMLAEYCLPLVKPFGYFIAMKGKLNQELEDARKAIQLLGGEVADLIDFQLPFSHAERSLILIQKIKETPVKYPRNSALIKNKPL